AGEQAFFVEPGAAKFIPKGARLIFQLHYTPNGKAQKDRSSIGLIFAKEPPKRKIETQPVYNFLFRIPPGAANHEVESSFTFKKDGYIYGLMPHMHLRGKDFTIRAIYPDKREETLLFVPKVSFNWQGAYRPAGAAQDAEGDEAPLRRPLRQLESQPAQPRPDNSGNVGRPNLARDDDRLGRLRVRHRRHEKKVTSFGARASARRDSNA